MVTMPVHLSTVRLRPDPRHGIATRSRDSIRSKIIQQATGTSNARILGQENHLGRVRAGWNADLIVVNAIRWRISKCFIPTGVDEIREGKAGSHPAASNGPSRMASPTRTGAAGQGEEMVAQARAAKR